MALEKRVTLIRMIDKMEKCKNYSDRLGLVNKSYLKGVPEKKDSKQ